MKLFFSFILACTLFFSGCSVAKEVTYSNSIDEPDTETFSESSSSITEEPSQNDDSSIYDGPLSILTGTQFPREYKPVLVIIENNPTSRPQSGLIDADIVYEVMVEGRITRFLAVFNDKDVNIAGPIRSIRHYYLDIYREWDSILVHYGGSRFARDIYLEDKTIRRIDGMVRHAPFWRDKQRKAPHNAYVNITDCRKELTFNPNERDFDFATGNNYEGSEYSHITIPYHSSHTVNAYEYSEETGNHLRYINNKPHVDRETDRQLEVTNIIIQYAQHTSMNTKEGHIDISLVGAGKARYYFNGITFEGAWEKKSPQAKTYFMDYDGREIALMPGNTWIHVVPMDLKVETK